MPAFDRDRAARILVDAIALGDKAAADKWQVSEKTIQRYRERMQSDPDLSAFVQSILAAEAREWRKVRLNFLRTSIAKLTTLVEAASEPKHIRDVSEAIRVVGELQLASDALNVDAGEASDVEGNAAPRPGAAEPPSVH